MNAFANLLFFFAITYFILILKSSQPCVVFPFRHSNSKAASKNGRTFLACEDDMSDIYPLQLRLSTPSEDNILGVRISKKVHNLAHVLLLIVVGSS